MDEAEVTGMEKSLAEYLRREIRLNVEQVLVRAGGLKKEVAKSAISPALTPPPPAKSPEEVAKSSIEGAIATVKKASGRIEKIIEPSMVEGFYVGTDEKAPAVSIILKIKRDGPLSEEQTKWLRQILSDELRLPLELKVETVPSEEAKAAALAKALKKKKRK